MVGKWRARFVASRLDGLADEPRPGQPRKITDERVEEVIVKTLEDKPPDLDTHWSTRSMAKAAGLNQTAVSRIWRAFGLKPHVQETWKLSTDPQFIEKVRDVVGLYMDPPEHAVVLCVDEKTQIQAIDRTAPCLPILPTTSGGERAAVRALRRAGLDAGGGRLTDPVRWRAPSDSAASTAGRGRGQVTGAARADGVRWRASGRCAGTGRPRPRRSGSG